jgi:TPR repeat protein
MKRQTKKGYPNLQILSCTALLALSLPPLSAAVQGDGYAAYKSGDYRNAARLLKVPAKRGDAKAQHMLGTLYLLGQGVDYNEQEAFRWCRLAAEEGYLEAQYQLGLMYLKGEGVDESDGTAIQWLSQASRAGHKQASRVLEYVINNDSSYGC